MAYENYSFVTWTDLTAITGARLQQMSTNIEEVKDANDNKPKGLLKLREASSTYYVNTNINNEYELIALKDETGSAGPDNRVTISNDRWYRLTVNFPGFSIASSGGEDSTYFLSIYQGVFGSGSPEQKANYRFQSEAITFVNTASATASISNEQLKSNTRIAAGTYSVVVQSTGLTNESFYIKIGKIAGASGNNNASSYSVQASSTEPLQFYVEDIGGVA